MQEGWMTPLGSGEIDHDFIMNITAHNRVGNEREQHRGVCN